MGARVSQLIDLKGKLMSVSGNERVFGYGERNITPEQERKTLICVRGANNTC